MPEIKIRRPRLGAAVGTLEEMGLRADVDREGEGFRAGFREGAVFFVDRVDAVVGVMMSPYRIVMVILRCWDGGIGIFRAADFNGCAFRPQRFA